MNVQFPLPLPDDPKKWEGWSKYKSPNLYERLCLDPKQNPNNDLIEEHCRELLRWWQKKLPLKNQPSNPIAQLLRPGLDESTRFLTQARAELLDPQRRRAMDNQLAAQAQEQTIAEFHKYLTFAIADGLLTPDEERNLFRFGHEHHLPEEQMRAYIEAELKESGARRAVAAEPAPPKAEAPRAPRPRRQALAPKDEFLRMLRLTGLDSEGMSDDTRDAFVNMAENLGLDPGEAEDLIDDYLDEADGGDTVAQPAPAARNGSTPVAPAVARQAAAAPKNVQAVPDEAAPAFVTGGQTAEKHDPFENAIGMRMLFVPAAEFTMGSEAPDAAPNERPLTKVTLSSYFIAKHPVTNAEFELFDPSHSRKRTPGAGDRHPVVHVSSLEALKFCQWLSARERKRYRLPTEAEWEYAARGTDARKYPWGNHERRGDLANFADRNTVFAWSDREINDGYPESSPVGAYPRGASPFGVEDMAGNVWEWCHDYFEAYRGAPKANPRGPTAGRTRVYRGGSWKSRFNSLRATVRSSNAPNYSCNDLGFRIVCECEG